MAAPAAFGQVPNSPIAFVNREAIAVSFVPVPSVGAPSGGGGPAADNPWLKVEFHYGTTDAVTKAYPYVDAIQFKVWIEGLDLFAPNPAFPGKGVAVALTGSVTYLNVGAGRDLYGAFYVHPSTLARFSSERGYEDFDRKFNIHLEAYVGGIKVDYFDKTKENDLNWYQPLRVVPGLVYRQDQCPFLLVDPDRYPVIKPPETAQ